MTQGHRFLAAAIAAAVTLGAPEVWAQRGEDWMPKKQGHRLGGHIEIWPARDLFAQSAEFVGQIAVIDELMIDFAIPAGYVDFDGPGNDHFVFGNPRAGAHWGDKLIPELAMWAGGTLTFPAIFDPGFVRGAAAGILALNRAYFDLDRFLIETMAIRPQVGVEAHFARYFFVRGDFGFPLFIDVGGNPNDVGFAVETAGEFEARAPVGVGGGARLQVVGVATDDYAPSLDHAQVAIEPFFSYEPFGRTGFFARLGFLLALDEPLGFGFDCCNELATVRAHLGGKW